MKKAILILLLTLVPFMLTAQSDDPEIIKAKEETAVIFDLGRFFGYLQTMEKEAPELALSKAQIEELYLTLNYFIKKDRIKVDDAEWHLTYMEEELLTIDQLIYVDELAIEKMATRVPGSGGGSEGGGQMASYIAGGAFNPLKDETKTIGQDVASFFTYLKKKTGM